MSQRPGDIGAGSEFQAYKNMPETNCDTSAGCVPLQPETAPMSAVTPPSTTPGSSFLPPPDSAADYAKSNNVNKLPSADDFRILAVEDYLDEVPWDDNSRNHNKAYRAFKKMARLNTGPAAALAEVEKRIRRAGGIVDYHDLSEQLRRAYEFVGKVAAGDINIPMRQKTAPFTPVRLKEIASNVDIDDIAAFVCQQSPIPPSSVSAEGFLNHLYQRGECVVIFTNQESHGQALFVAGGTRPSLFPLLTGGPDGVWFLVQPVDGDYHWNPRQNTMSRRSQESVNSWRYLVLESDEADANDWLKMLIQVPLPIVAMYSSGGRSIHALVRVEAASKAEWDGIKNRLAKALLPLGKR